ncbi:hypothetical protein FB45DRAFT_911326 [Roridomyces roridus]|uniref:SnoaL-like domain-containing protein n=1 Tax=Roridomyces roridus TaxID=1738132 RepID=A0AAD7C0G1_9AGAR|nr:hypothetical protein FB45DRAFT_911326 [Roridomyces roridus]
MSSTLLSAQLAGAQACLDYVSSANVDGLRDLFAPNFTHELFPSTTAGSQTKRSKDDFLGSVQYFWANVLERLKFLSPFDIVQAPDVVVLHVKADGMTKWGKPYTNEYMMTFRFEGGKIISIREFVDSLFSADLMASVPAPAPAQ